MKRSTDKYMYLDKLDITFFKDQIQDCINYCLNDFDATEGLERLNNLRVHVVGLRDTFYIFSIDDIKVLLDPIEVSIKRLTEKQEKETEDEIPM